MGYTTEFIGEIVIDPPLNAYEIEYLREFAHVRHMKRKKGPYYILGTGYAGQGDDVDVIDTNFPDDSQPGLWCQWTPSFDGKSLHWDGGEKFYDSAEWMIYLINHFLKPDAEASKSGDWQFTEFTFDHVLNGEIDAQGEDPDDRWKLIVKDNVVTIKTAKIVWE